MRGFSRFVPPVSIVLVVLAGCSTERSTPTPTPTQAPVAAPTPDPSAPVAELAPAISRPALPAAEREGRDPFEPASTPGPTPPTKDERPRKSKRFTIDELKLVGIVSGGDESRAMLVDPRGKGWVVTRGQLIGRAEVLHDSQGDHSVSWKVDRIRESDVILVREDATHSPVPSSTRVLALRHEAVIADDAELDD